MVPRAVSSWSLHRTLGRFRPAAPLAHGEGEASPSNTGEGIPLLDLPEELARHGFSILHLCHFHLPSRSPEYLSELRSTLDAHGVTLDTLLIDDGDVTEPGNEDAAEAWIGEWLDTATALGATRARVMAGRSAPTPELIAASAERLARLAATHTGVRVITENWMGMVPDAATANAILDASGDDVGFLIDLGNWHGAGKYDELAKVAPRAEVCHAKCHYTGLEPDRDDFLRSLQVLADAGFDGPLVLIYDSESDDEWSNLEVEYEMVTQVFG